MPLMTCIATVTRTLTPCLLSLAIALPVFADPGGAGSLDPLDAKHCVRIARDDKAKAQTLTNTCSQKIEVAWCHTGSKEKGTQHGVCGEDKYFRKHKTLDPGKSENNRFSLPLDAQIHFGACIGGYYTLKAEGNAGRYTCRTPKETKAEAEKHEPTMLESVFYSLRRYLLEYDAAKAEETRKHLLELTEKCLDDKKSPACTEMEQIIKKYPRAAGSIRG